MRRLLGLVILLVALGSLLFPAVGLLAGFQSPYALDQELQVYQPTNCPAGGVRIDGECPPTKVCPGGKTILESQRCTTKQCPNGFVVRVNRPCPASPAGDAAGTDGESV